MIAVTSSHKDPAMPDPAAAAAPAPFDLRDFRAALGAFATGVTIVTTRGRQGEPVGLTVNSFTSVSLDPPLVLFCLERAAHSHAAFAHSGCFSLSILAEEHQHLSRGFAASPERHWDEIEPEVQASGAPIIKGALAWIDCKTEAIHRAGDHDILVGRVVALGHARQGRPLLYWRGRYRHLDEGD